MKTVWIPALPAKPDLLANAVNEELKKVEGARPHDLTPFTKDVAKALQFDTEPECQAWCDRQRSPKFAPVEREVEDAVM